MLKRLTALLLILNTGVAYGAAKIQDADVKSLSQLTSAGATAAALINTTKLYDATYGNQVSVLISKSGIAGIASAANGTILTSNGSGQASWVAGLTNPMTTVGDLIVGGSGGASTRLAAGSAGSVLTSAGTAATPVWQPEIIARYYNTAGNSVSSGTAGQIPFATKDIDTASMCTSTGCTIPTGAGGRYRVTSRLIWQSRTSTSGAGRATYIYKNGTNIETIAIFYTAGNTSPVSVFGSDVFTFAAGDVISFYGYSAEGGTTTLDQTVGSNYYVIERIGN